MGRHRDHAPADRGRPTDERPEVPRCPQCGSWMAVDESLERVVIYRCCGIERTKFKPQFVEPTERLVPD